MVWKMSTEMLLNRISMIGLIIGGAFFIYEGIVMINIRKDNPDKVPEKVEIAGGLTLALGIFALGLAGMHLFLDKKTKINTK